MLAYLVLGLSLLAAIYFGGRWFIAADPRLLAGIVRYTGLGLLIVLALFFMFTGRFALGLLPAAFAFTLWRAMRGGGLGFPSGGWRPGGGGTGSAGRTSNVKTEFLRMTLAHDTGEMSGEILRGRFAGDDLSDLSLASLLELLEECRAEDPPSVQLLETYLDRVHGADWREQAGHRANSGASQSPGGAMTVEEARDILGVDENASADEIRAAHHRQMMKHHPDRGGSSYLAARINEAKDRLLQS